MGQTVDIFALFAKIYVLLFLCCSTLNMYNVNDVMPLHFDSNDLSFLQLVAEAKVCHTSNEHEIKFFLFIVQNCNRTLSGSQGRRGSCSSYSILSHNTSIFFLYIERKLMGIDRTGNIIAWKEDDVYM